MPIYSTYTDGELIRFLQKGDAAAFTEIYHRYWKKLLSVACNKLPSVEEAQELVQDVFLDLWNRKKNVEIRTELKAYLATAVKYRVINMLAKHARTRQYLKEKNLAAENTSHNHTEEWLSFEELKDKLASLVAALPEKCRLVYRLSRDEGYTHKEIAQLLRLSEKSVESNLARALKKLRTGLSQFISIIYLRFLNRRIMIS
jgi:RNA polymerase sigma-70 factor, Bacteroides expansion family 1